MFLHLLIRTFACFHCQRVFLRCLQHWSSFFAQMQSTGAKQDILHFSLSTKRQILTGKDRSKPGSWSKKANPKESKPEIQISKAARLETVKLNNTEKQGENPKTEGTRTWSDLTQSKAAHGLAQGEWK